MATDTRTRMIEATALLIQLVVEVTRASVADVTERLGAALLEESDPAVAIHHIYQSVARMLEENEFSLGCPVAPVVLDAPNNVPDLAEICRSAFEQWIGLLRQAFVRAGVPERRAQALALLVESSLDGLMVIA
ncbi:MAG: TetR/AcrR family transcriptional regulator, partial [Mesorhizobium sp.]